MDLIILFVSNGRFLLHKKLTLLKIYSFRVYQHLFNFCIYITQLAGFAVQLFVARAVDLNEYLDDKLRQSKKEFIKIHIQETSPGEFALSIVHFTASIVRDRLVARFSFVN